jgi:hypothetical protein
MARRETAVAATVGRTDAGRLDTLSAEAARAAAHMKREARSMADHDVIDGDGETVAGS